MELTTEQRKVLLDELEYAIFDKEDFLAHEDNTDPDIENRLRLLKEILEKIK